MRKWLRLVISILLPILVVSFLYSELKPVLRNWLKTQIENYLNSTQVAKISIEKLDWQLFVPQLFIHGIRAEFKSESIQSQEIWLTRITTKLDLLYLLSGRVSISTIHLDGANISLVVKQSKDQSDTDLPFDQIIQFAEKIPIQSVLIDNTQLKVNIDAIQSTVQVNDLALLIKNNKNSLALDLKSTNAFIENANLSYPFVFDLSLLVKPNELFLKQYSISSQAIKADGSLTAFKPNQLITNPWLKGETNFQANLDSLQFLIDKINPNIKAFGSIASKLEFELKEHKWSAKNIDFRSNQLKINKFNIGQFDLKGKFENGVLNLNQINLDNSGGKITSNKTKLQIFNDANELNLALEAGLQGKNLDLHQLLINLGVGAIPLELKADSKLDCNGAIWPETKINCKGDILGNGLLVASAEPRQDTKNQIVKIEKLSALGEVTITKQDVSYAVDLSVGESKGKSSGVVSYLDGFKINYSSDELKFKDLGDIANLTIEGQGAINGTTEGDSSRGVFNMSIKGKEVVFEDFILGQPDILLSYEKAVLKLLPIKGEIGNSKYQMDLAVDLKSKTLSGQGSFPFYELNDLLKIFSRKFQSPVELTGQGTGQIKISGPLQFNQLTYDLQTQITNGSAAGENFDRIQLQLLANQGEVDIKQALLIKNKSEIRMSGQGHPNGQINVTIDGRNFLLEESENIQRLNLNAAGNFDFLMTLNGHVLSPDAVVNGKVGQVYINDLEVAPSAFNIKLRRNFVEGNAQLVGNQLNTESMFPFNDEAGFLFKMNAQNWNYASLLSLVGGGSLLSEYQAGLTGRIELSSERGGLWSASGTGRIQNLFLKRGKLSLTNRLPMELTMTDGIASLKNFKIEGDQAQIEIKGNAISKNDFNLRMQANAELRLFHIFLPFLEDFSGRARVGINIGGPITKPQVLGEATVNDTFLKLKSFPHPFEKLQGKAVFSQSKIILSDVTGQIAGGNLSGEGNILIQGIKDLPMDIRAKLNSAKFAVPDKVISQGSADLRITGNWFPFVLSGTYKVDSGLIEKEFGEEAAAGSLKQSSYLPKVILQSAFEPLALDMRVDFEKGIAIKNNLMEGKMRGSLGIKGNPASPGLLGRINFDKQSKIFFRETPFEVLSGVIDFKDPTELNPDLFISAQTRKSNYDISLLIQGTGKSPLLRMNSIPPLTEQDIISLLALGFSADQAKTPSQGGEQENATANSIGMSLLSNVVNRGLKKQGVELFNFNFTSQYDDTKNISVKKFTISGKVTNKVNYSASELVGETGNTTEVKLRYDINQNFSAVTSWENRKGPESGAVSNTQKETQSILGLDLEFRQEFR